MIPILFIARNIFPGHRLPPYAEIESLLQIYNIPRVFPNTASGFSITKVKYNIV